MPPGFDPYDAEKDCRIGVSLSPDQAKNGNRRPDAIPILGVGKDKATYNRPYEYKRKWWAEVYWKRDYAGLQGLDNFIKQVDPRRCNEYLMRLRWSCDGTSRVSIFYDNLKSRLMGQLVTCDLERRLQAQQAENERYLKYETSTKGYHVPINFYVPVHRGEQTVAYSLLSSTVFAVLLLWVAALICTLMGFGLSLPILVAVGYSVSVF